MRGAQRLRCLCTMFVHITCARSPSLLLSPPRSTIRGAMVRVMLAGGPRQQCPYRRHRSRGREEEDEHGLDGEDLDDSLHTAFGDTTASEDGSCQSDALTAESETSTMPRDSSTCILWCAVALGALVRGYPLAQVVVALLFSPLCLSYCR